MSATSVVVVGGGGEVVGRFTTALTLFPSRSSRSGTNSVSIKCERVSRACRGPIYRYKKEMSYRQAMTKMKD